MIDIKAIRKKSENSSELKRLRDHIIKAVNTAADNGQYTTSIICNRGLETYWRREVFRQIIEDLKKDGFNVYERDNPIAYETWIYIDWAEPYADTDSVKLPESCPEVAKELPQTCNTCRWYNVTRIPPCDIGNEPKNFNMQGCNLYESED